jgi:outer membrane lipoprotein-sorting protein
MQVTPRVGVHLRARFQSRMPTFGLATALAVLYPRNVMSGLRFSAACGAALLSCTLLAPASEDVGSIEEVWRHIAEGTARVQTLEKHGAQVHTFGDEHIKSHSTPCRVMYERPSRLRIEQGGMVLISTGTSVVYQVERMGLTRYTEEALTNAVEEAAAFIAPPFFTDLLCLLDANGTNRLHEYLSEAELVRLPEEKIDNAPCHVLRITPRLLLEMSGIGVRHRGQTYTINYSASL